MAREASRATDDDHKRTSSTGSDAESPKIGPARRAAAAKRAIEAGLPELTDAGFLTAEEAHHAAMALRRGDGRRN
jgi:hypothetical protein